MSQQWSAATERRASMKIWMVLMATVVSVVICLSLPRTASALSLPLLDPTTGLVTRVLQDTTDTLLPTQASYPATTAHSTTSNRTGSSPSSQSSIALRAPQAEQPQSVTTVSKTPLATITPLDTTWLTKSAVDSVAPAQFDHSLAVDEVPQTAVGSAALLEPTEHGWSLFGVLWCWWLLGLAAVGVAVYALIHRGHRQSTLVS